MADQLQQDVITGARVRLEIDGKKVGHMTDVNVSLQFQNIDLEECGDAIATAIMTVGVKAFLTAGYAKIRTTDPYKDLFIPSLNTRAIVNWPEMTGTVFDTQTDTPLINVRGLKPEAFDFRTGARTLTSQNMRWRGREVVQPSEG